MFYVYALYVGGPYLLNFIITSSLLYYLFIETLTTNQMVSLILLQGGMSLMLTLILSVFYKNHLVRMIYMGSILESHNYTLRPAAQAFIKPFVDQHKHEQRLIGRVLKRMERKLHV